MPESGVIFRHALRNAFIPVVTIIALDFGYLFSGALTIEIVFAFPGMGKLIFDAIMGNDFNLAMVALLFATTMTLAGNLVADLAYCALDPRITYGTRAAVSRTATYAAPRSAWYMARHRFRATGWLLAVHSPVAYRLPVVGGTHVRSSTGS